MIGRRLAQYEITAKLGEGGMGVVYRARDTKLDRDVALKLLPVSMAGDPVRLERLTREAKLAAGLNHPNIVTLHSVEEFEGEHFLTMELVSGRTLDRILAKGGLELGRLFDLAIPIADAVASAHEAGITHRDLKPANVMVDDEGRVKILDFGLARFDPGFVDANAATQAMTEAITGEGVVVGTVRYMSPEQARGEVVDSRSDIFSLGTMLYEMATGRQPFAGASSAESMSAILRDDPPPIDDVKRELPHHLGRIIQHCLEKDPRRRYQSALDVRNALDALRREVESGASRVASSATVPRAGGRRRVAAAAVVAAAAALAALYLTRDRAGMAPTEEVATTERRKTLVVLPFENLGAAEDAYFSAGMTDELTSRLSRVSGLGVIARSSAVRYADSELSARQIGTELEVDYVVEGTVRWAKNTDGSSRLRITPSLVYVVDGTQVWSASFDRELEDVFEIQAEIAGHVIEEVGVTLLSPEREAVEELPTDNPDAYQAFLKAQEHWQFAGYDSERFTLAAELFERAAELDPDFVEPLATLVSVYGVMAYGDASQELLAKARHALDRAVALAPDDPRVEIARGVWHYYGEGDYEAAYARFESAAGRLPNSIEPLQLMGFIRRRQGRLPDAVDHFLDVLELSPRDEHTHYELGRTYEAMRRWPEADRYLERARALAPDNVQMYDRHAWLLLRWKGDVAGAVAIAAEAPVVDQRGYEKLQEGIEWLQRDWPALRARLARRVAQADGTSSAHCEDAFYLASVYHRMGEAELAEATSRRALEWSRAYVEATPQSAFGLLALAAIESLRGNREAALAALDRLDELAGGDRFIRPWVDERRALALTQLGDSEAAVALLVELLAQTYDEPLTVPLLRLDPSWDPLRDYPGFQHLIEKDSSI